MGVSIGVYAEIDSRRNISNKNNQKPDIYHFRSELSPIMKIDLTLTTVTLCITFLHFGQDASCVPDDSGAFSGPMSPLSPHKRQNPSDQELGFLAGKSLKRQGDGENDMLRNLAISRLVKRAPSEDDMLRNLAISRLVKRSP